MEARCADDDSNGTLLETRVRKYVVFRIARNIRVAFDGPFAAFLLSQPLMAVVNSQIELFSFSFELTVLVDPPSGIPPELSFGQQSGSH